MRVMLRQGDIEGDLLKPENWTPHYRELQKQFDELVGAGAQSDREE